MGVRAALRAVLLDLGVWGGAITILRTSHLVEDEGAGCHTTTEPQECISTHREVVCSRSCC